MLKKLKVTLSVFFVFTQCLNNYDKRYDTFFASILNRNSFTLPKNIKIISWNYDFQIERAYAEYTDDYRVDSTDSSLNIQSKFSGHNFVEDGFCICKINGTANIVQPSFSSSFQYTEALNSTLDIKSIESALRNYAFLLFSNQSDCLPALSFAWENDNTTENNIITKTKAITKETNILIVVGYSFPFFNRHIDREIIGGMNNLEKIYLQAPDAKNLVERFESVRPDIDIKKLIPRFDVEQFLLPNEL